MNIRWSKTIAGACAALAVAAVGDGLRNQAAAAELRLASPFPAIHLMQVNILEPWAKELAEKTKGDLQVRIHAGGALGTGPATYERVRTGVADIGFTLAGYTSDQFPRTLLIEIPGLAVNNVEATGKLWSAIELLKPEYPGIKILGLWTVGPYIFGMRNDQVREIADVRNKRIRVPSRLMGETMKQVGANPIFMPVADVYHALQTGLLDGHMVVGSGIQGFKLGEVTRYYTNYPFGLSPVLVVMNERSYDRLPPEQRELIDKTTGREFSLRAAAVYDRETIRQLDGEVKAGRAQLLETTEQQRKQWDEAIRDVPANAIKELEGKGIDARAVLNAMK